MHTRTLKNLSSVQDEINCQLLPYSLQCKSHLQHVKIDLGNFNSQICLYQLFIKLGTDQLWYISVYSVAVFPLQEEAGSLLVDLSSSLHTISVNQHSEDDEEVVQAATPIVDAASNILNVSSNVRTKLSLILADVIPLLSPRSKPSYTICFL